MIFHKGYKHEQYGKSRGTNAPKKEMTSERRGEIYDMARAEEGVRLKTNKDRNLSMQPSGIEAAYLKDGFEGAEAHIQARDAMDDPKNWINGVDPYS
jgi:hypothetical protein